MAMAIIVLLNNGIRFKRPNLSFLNLGILKECLPFAVIFLLASIHMRLDGFLLERMHPSGAHEAGIYASGYRLLDASRMVSFLMGSFLLPYIARRWSQGLGLTDVILNSRHMLMMLSIPILAITMVLAPWIQTSLYHQSDSEAAGALRWSMAGLIGYSLIQLYGTVMIATGYIKQFCYFTLLSIGLNLIFNFFLIPLYGAKGCGISAFISQEFCAAAVILFVRYKLKISINIRSLAIYSFTGMSILMFLLIGNQLNLNSLLLIILVPFITISIIFTSNLFPIQSWIRWIKNRKLAEAAAR
jgi:O-antigen/teichoic acid export membrane protein